MKKIVFMLAAGLMISVLMIGCSNEDPWDPLPTNPLEVLIVSAPTTDTAIPDGSSVGFSWTAQGGSGEVTGYSWYLEPMESAYGDLSTTNSVTYHGLEGDSAGTDYVFHIRVRDTDSDTDEATASFTVSAAVAGNPDTDAPIVTLSDQTIASFDGAFIATGAPVAFTWMGDDGNGNLDFIEYQYIFPTMSDTSTWMVGNTVSFVGADVPATDPAMFYVRGRDATGNISDWAGIDFTIKDASILYIDDFQWLTGAGGVNTTKERDQKQFYRNCLEGYAFAEWDNDAQGMPELADLIPFDVVIWCADSDAGSADPSYRLWTEVGAADPPGGVLADFINGGGKLIITGSEIFNYLYWDNPPFQGDFEEAYLGVRGKDEDLISDVDTVVWWLDGVEYDTAVVSPDSVEADTSYDISWDYYYFSTAVGVGDYPDTMEVDIAKNSDQILYGNNLILEGIDTTWWFGGNSYDAPPPPPFDPDSVVVDTAVYLSPGVETIFNLGPEYTGSDYYVGYPCGWIYAPGGNPMSATLAFDTYSLALSDVKQTFQMILTEFGE